MHLLKKPNLVIISLSKYLLNQHILCTTCVMYIIQYVKRLFVCTDYAAVVSCFQETEVQSGYKSCHETLRTDIQTLVNKTVEESSTSRIDISVVVEKACQYVN